MKLEQCLLALGSFGAAVDAFSLFGEGSFMSSLRAMPSAPKNVRQTLREGLSGVRGALRNPLQDSRFETLISSVDDSYSMRLRTVDPKKLGIDSVKQWSGYLDYEDKKHFFYWFFESRNDPKNDPVILWLNGGPGCSSFTGLFFELGPSSVGEDLKPIYNPYSWNSNASVIFLEQPLGVGFSYGDEKVTSTKIAGRDVYVFLEMFFDAFPHLRNNDFHIAGESYAGHYIPQIAHEIVTSTPTRTFNLTSIMIGNGLTDALVQSQYYEPMACGEGGYPAVLTDEKCDKMKVDANRCAKLTEACYRSESTLPCVVAMSYCNWALMNPYQETGLNVYDIRTPCEEGAPGGLCYRGLGYVEDYMNQKEVQEALGSDIDSYTGCNQDVFAGFAMTGDEYKPFQQHIAKLLDLGLPVLIYAGDKDYICNWLGNKAWTDELEWSEQGKYAGLPLKPWKSSASGEELGQKKSHGPLTFLRVYDAGHMVPYDQPEAALEMLNSWIGVI